jgi:iron(III) transport system substrate-binding protein
MTIATRRAARWLPLLLGVSIGATATAAGKWRDSPEVRELYRLAQREGEVVVWGTAGPEVNWIPAAFAKEFPGITVKVVGDTNVVTRTIAEARAGRHELDVFWCALNASVPVLERGLLASVDWRPFGIQAQSTGLDGRMAYTNNLVYTVVYNSKLISREQAPRSWSELLEPKYRDKMAASPFLMTRLVGAIGLEWGEERALGFARGLRDNSGILLTSALLDQLLQSGERSYAVGVVDQISQQWQRNGAAVEYVIPEPIVMLQFGATVMERAPHPNAARLIAGWMATPEGMKAREEATFATDFRPGSSNPRARELHARGAVFIPDDLERTKQRNELINKVNRVLSGQER